MNKRIPLLLVLLGVVSISTTLALSMPNNAFAQTPPERIKLENPIQAESIPELVNSIVKAILGMVGALALFMFVYGGMLWMTSAGNTQRIEKGKETLIWATIGLIIIFASYAILSFIFTALSGKG